MRFFFTFLGLLLVVAVIGLLAKKQFTSLNETRRGTPVPGHAVPADGSAPAGTPAQQVRQVEKAVQDLMQRPRPMPEDP